ncbi:hypothetical protein C6N75_15200 [Streptomyces solincola]|uniref:Uncharacterized protein n=1 Tax=Streptomyces solincola TaxID=2100817 RepID=A0A2S9PVE3_9ACTN|nr:hypothetical protein [Streptomyces solincola]PRH78379.1 hypothetical protein C6N75_15200 [Streptomyces solincola]
MTSTTPHAIRSVRLAARVTTLLARHYPEAGPDLAEGFRVMSHDQQEPRRMFVRWYGAEPPRPWALGGGLGVISYRVRIAEALTRAGYAVTLPPDGWDVYVDDRPVDTSGPRYAAVPSSLPFGDQWLVMDQWTRVHTATAATEEEAKDEAAHRERRHVLTDARLVTVSDPDLWPHLERADELLGDGLTWLRQEVHDVTRYGDLVEHERIDALVQTANALRAGREVAQQGRMVTWRAPERYEVRWVPKSSTPTVGYFPGFQRGPVQDDAIAVLVAAGLRMVVYGEPIGEGAWQCEQNGVMVTAAEPTGERAAGVSVDAIGRGMEEQTERVPEVLRAAGWTVTADRSWTGAWAAFPPAG